MKKSPLPPEELLIGAHTSAAGGAYNALLEGREIGATTIQFFTANQRQWNSKTLDPKAVDLWKSTIKETMQKEVMSHDSYLINLGCPDPVNYEKSIRAFEEEIKRCLQLDITYLNFHPGAALKSDRQECLDRISDTLLTFKPLLDKGNTRLLLETTAGQGSVVGDKFEDLAYIISKVKDRIPLGICIDTCHIFVAGYDIRTPEAWHATLKQFDDVIGLKHLYAFHVNDSVKDLGSRVDRHADLGKGKIGIESFKFLMRDPRTRELPKYLETVSGKDNSKNEIAMLREFAKIK